MIIDLGVVGLFQAIFIKTSGCPTSMFATPRGKRSLADSALNKLAEALERGESAELKFTEFSERIRPRRLGRVLRRPVWFGIDSLDVTQFEPVAAGLRA